MGLMVSQLWETEKGIRPQIKHNLLKLPLGRTVFVPSKEWVVYHLPWVVRGDLWRVSFHCSLQRAHFLSTVSVTESGQLRLNVFNTEGVAQVLPGRSIVVNMWYSGACKSCFLPAEPALEKNNVAVKVLTWKGTDVLKEFADVFDDSTMKITPAMKHLNVRFEECKLKCDPDFGGRRTVPSVDQLVSEARIREELASFLKKGFIERVNASDGVFLTPIFFLPKKDGTKIRTLNDYRLLNAMCDLTGATFRDTLRTMRSIPAHWKIYSKLDLSNGFFSVGLERKASRLFGFNIFNETYVWRVIPQGFSWSPIWFMERIKDIFFDLSDHLVVYADDILVGSRTQEEHDLILSRVLARMRKFGLKLNKDKVILKKREVDFLGFTLRNGKFDLNKYLAEKAAQICNVSHYKHLERLIGALNFCRSHVGDLGRLIAPLMEYKTVAMKGGEMCTSDWWKKVNKKTIEVWQQVLKGGLSLSLSRKFERFELHVDWCGGHRGFALTGLIGVNKYLVAVGSARDPIKDQSSFLGEIRALEWALSETRHLRGNWKTTVFCDNQGVVSSLLKGIEAFCNDRRSARIFGRICGNEPFAHFVYLPGTRNGFADILSRLREGSQGQEIDVLESVERPNDDVIYRRIQSAHFGHWGVQTTLQNLLMEGERWPRVEEDVRNFIRRCPHCAFNGDEQVRDLPSVEVSTAKGERVFMDHCGPFFDGSHILVVVDDATKWMTATRTPGTGAVHAIRILDEWMQKWGRISAICTDNATCWNSELFTRWAALNRIEVRKTPSYYHQGNAVAERGIQTLCTRIRRFLNGAAAGWPAVIESAVHAINTSWNSVIRTAPAALMKGTDRNGVLLSEAKISELWTKALESAKEKKEYERKRFEWKHPRRSRPFNLGDKVLKKNYYQLAHRLKKLGPKWIGPFVLEEQVSDSTWLARGTRRGDQKILVHSSQIKPCFL